MKLKFKKESFIKKYFILALIFGLTAYLIIVSSRWAKNKGSENLTSLLPTATPTLVPPTPTPTLTPEQIAEIRRKEFEAWNAKYGPCKYVPILMYHHVMEAAAAKAIQASYLNVPPNIFRQQLDYLLGKGYVFIGLDQMVEGIRNGSLPAKPAVLTFDDAYADFYDYVFPVLKEKNIKATLFVISQYVGGERYAGWGQIKEMSDSNLVLIGDHTLNHSSLPKATKEEEINQILSAKNIIEEHIKRPVLYFAYPYGGISRIAEEILKENNFMGAVVTTNSHPQCLGLQYEFSRIRIGATSLKNYGL